LKTQANFLLGHVNCQSIRIRNRYGLFLLNVVIVVVVFVAVVVVIVVVGDVGITIVWKAKTL